MPSFAVVIVRFLLAAVPCLLATLPGRSQQPTDPPPPPPGTQGPIAPYAASPPPGTLPPGYAMRRMPFVRADGTSPVVVVTIIVFVLALLFAGSCALVHTACNAM